MIAAAVGGAAASVLLVLQTGVMTGKTMLKMLVRASVEGLARLLAGTEQSR